MTEDNNNNNNDNINFKPTTNELNLAANAVFSNPDTEQVGSPPDGYRGLSTIAVQRVQNQINLSQYGAGPFDVWVVQWPFEAIVGSTCVASWDYGCFQDSTYQESKIVSLTTVPAWVAAGLSTGLEIGGLCAYVMAAGKSPFPGENGPYDPVATVRFDFGKDVLHDSARVIGGFYEVINTTAKIYQQGTSYSASIENPTNEKVWLYELSTDAFDNGVAMAMYDQELCPMGDVQSMLKVPNSLTLNAADGVFAPARLNLEGNAPSQSLGYQAVFVSTSHNAANISLPGNARVMLVFGQRCTINWADNARPLYPSAVQGEFYKTNLNTQVSVFQGQSSLSSFTIVRRLATQCFATPYSDYLTFATYRGPPHDANAMSALSAAIDNTPDFFPSAMNKNGGAWKKLSGVFKKALKPIAPVVTGMGKTALMTAIQANPALSAIANNPSVMMARAAVKAAKKRKQDKKKNIQNKQQITKKK